MRTLALSRGLWPLLGLTLLGCSDAGSIGPAPATQGAPSPVAAAAPADAPGIVGLYELHFEGTPTGVQGTLEPVRAGTAFGDQYMLDASRYFNGAPCVDCARLTGVGLTAGGELAAQLEVRHPFPMPAQPLESRSRLDLHVFDLAGMLLFRTSPVYFPGIQQYAAPLRLVNADGYSRLFDAPLERVFGTVGIDIHPYKIFNVDDTSGNYDPLNPNGFTNLFDPHGFNVFPQGARDTEEFILRLPQDTNLVEFRTNALFAITANWGAASNNQRGLDYLQRGNPAYLLPEFAQKAPWRVSVSLPMNTLKADEPASGAEIRIDVHDWQLGAPVDGGYPNPANLGAVKAPSDIAQVRVEIPGLIPSAITIDPGSAGGSGFVRTFTTNITNAGEAPEGTYLGLVEVVDSRTGDQGLAQDNPAPFALGQLATYQLFEIPVAPPTSTGTFGEPRLVTLYEPNTFVGNFNMTVAELTTNGTDLYFIYEGGLYQLVLARSTNGGNLFSNFDVLEEIYGPCDPILAVERGTNTLHVSAAAPYEDGLWSLTTTNNGTSWGALKPIWQEEFTDVDVHTICAAPGEMPVAIFGQSTFTTGLQSVLDSARLNGANWVDGGSPSDVHPYAGDLYRVDTDPGVVRLEDGTLVCLIMTNVRGIEANGDEELFEPVAVRSTNDGIAWQGWNYLHSLPTTSIDNISLTVKGNDVYVLELTGEHDLRLFKSTTAGASWTPMPLPAFLPKVHSRFGDISSGPGGLMAITYGPDNDNYWEADDLFVIKSTDSGATWGEPIRADGDPDKEFLVSAACSVFTDDGKLHVAFQDTRYWVEYKWSIVNEQ